MKSPLNKELVYLMLDVYKRQDQILVLYSFDSFKGDPYLYRAGFAG